MPNILTGTVTESDKVWKGKIEIPNLSEEHDAEEVDVSRFCSVSLSIIYKEIDTYQVLQCLWMS